MTGRLVLGKEALRIYDGLRGRSTGTLKEFEGGLDRRGYNTIRDYTISRRVGRAGLNTGDYGFVSFREGEENRYVTVGVNPRGRVGVIRGRYRDDEFISTIERDASANPEIFLDTRNPNLIPIRLLAGLLGYFSASSIKHDDPFLKFLGTFTGIALVDGAIGGLRVFSEFCLRVSEGVEYGRRAVRSTLMEASMPVESSIE